MDKYSQAIFSHKILSVSELKKKIKNFPRKNKVIMCHGTFDVVHPGHVRHLLYAKTKADILIASLTADIHINKGTLRPYVPENLRAINLAALEMVDYVIIDKNPTPVQNIKKIQPDFFAKGYEYNPKEKNIKTDEEIKTIESYGGEMIFTPGDIVYSSSALINMAPPSIATDKLINLLNSENITFEFLKKTINSLSDIKVHVIGDTIVDSFTQCSMAGGMTKTPTMSVKFEEKKDYVGGAGVVAKHLKAAGANVTFTTMLGDDELKSFVLNDLKRFKVKVQSVIDKTRPTTNKNAIIVSDYRLLKLDTLDNRVINHKILDKFEHLIKNTQTDAVVFSDFRHGIFNKETIPTLTKAIPKKTFKVADSQVASRWGNILEFKGFDLITPNEREARFSLGDQDSILRPLALNLFKQSKVKTLILKCASRGVIGCRINKNPSKVFFTIDSFTKNPKDPVGAGDALLAYSTLALIKTKNSVVSTIIGNLAAAVECEFDGNYPVTPDLILKKLNALEKEANFENQ